MFIVVSYDIVDDRRRTRLHRILKNFGTRVQYSVFECMLEPKDFTRLQATVTPVIKGDDHVRYYRLCDHCERQIMVIGGAVTQPLHTFVV
jgi:CRISPR-associated protein Cas2